MDKLKQLIVSVIAMIPVVLIAQNNSDIGIIMSTDKLAAIGAEYRKDFKENYRWKIGVFGGSEWYPNRENNIVSSSDTTVIMTRYSNHSNLVALRFGFERKLKYEELSIGLDLNVGYYNRFYQQSNYGYGIDENGNWVYADILSEEDFMNGYTPEPGLNRPVAIGEYDFAQAKRQFLNTDLRLSFNLDYPLGRLFLMHASFAGVFGMPIYMGSNDVNDPKGYYSATPPSVFNFNTNCNLGFRFKLGVPKEIIYPEN